MHHSVQSSELKKCIHWQKNNCENKNTFALPWRRCTYNNNANNIPKKFLRMIISLTKAKRNRGSKNKWSQRKYGALVHKKPKQNRTVGQFSTIKNCWSRTLITWVTNKTPTKGFSSIIAIFATNRNHLIGCYNNEVSLEIH